MSHPARGKRWDTFLPTLVRIGTMGIDGKTIAACRRQCGPCHLTGGPEASA